MLNAAVGFYFGAVEAQPVFAPRKRLIVWDCAADGLTLLPLLPLLEGFATASHSLRSPPGVLLTKTL
ncbi:hypothetical protein CMUS01_06751 [Colletotrichum musicola]|uniref:Uncharacterized protein n=1 Tax=Colletotrichum musicola TaxID=2175873 RepID=A0A8H6NGU1_9PEZI|nr:hypothetical protein CMUS01_06751 [Colletotrichum musicola]